MQAQMNNQENAKAIHKAFIIVAGKAAKDIIVQRNVSEHEHFKAYVVL